ncbi:hypothetical protein AQS8620_01375 [Aquimixticola soesokkakensis]|uniref:Periplasmic heavy metal sensor n=1 Tax=Aquimixticola soesokkakensis TaxID=1519096 RepID=A0A1Y5SGK0_9RHOB|nr:periplasmic heavy metal sensor [Aquimixticola soesokkakensis]SLN37474.1 hypothetical protein AQS8620_01375 [Aquimixticola soesokkakensis]
MARDTEQNVASPDPQSGGTPPKRRLRWRRGVLAVSLALNLAVVGLVAGAVLRGPPDRDVSGGRMMGARDIGFGPYLAALDDSDRKTIGRDFVRRVGSPSQMRTRIEDHFSEVLGALQREPFAPEVFEAALDSQLDELRAWQAAGVQSLVAHVDSMSEAQRVDFTARLESVIANPPRDLNKRDAGKGGKSGFDKEGFERPEQPDARN